MSDTKDQTSQSAVTQQEESPAAQQAAKMPGLRDNALEKVRKDTARADGGSSSLKGKVGIITGVASELGIGNAVVRYSAREGARHIYMVDWKELASSKSIMEALRNEFPNSEFTFIKGDAADAAVISGLVNRVIQEEGYLDFFFANAGVEQLPHPKTSKTRVTEGNDRDDSGDPGHYLPELWETVQRLEEADFLEFMRLNTVSAFVALKYASQVMDLVCPEKGKTMPGGSIILTSSVAGHKARFGDLAYSASKASVISLAQSMAYELAGRNIRVNALCPGLIETDATKYIFDQAPAGGIPAQGMLNPMLRHGLASEVAEMAVFLISDKASYINGQAINVDGGHSAGNPFMPRPL